MINLKYAFLIRKLTTTLTIFAALLLTSCGYLAQQNYQSHQIKNKILVIQSTAGIVEFSALPGDAIEVHYPEKLAASFPSFAKSETLKPVEATISENFNTITFINGELSAVIEKSDLSVSFFRAGELLTKQNTFFRVQKNLGFNFSLQQQEKIMGGGERVLGMDRRGYRLPLYNRAHYGYTLESEQMYFSLPMIMSQNKYAVLFDNSASGFLDIGKTEPNTLSFEAVGGRSAYIVFAGDSYPELINNYVDVTGKQPLPPRWAFANFASRFGYRTEQEVRDTIDMFIQQDFPVDAVILDLYWFGADIKGFVGNLDWDRKAFPTPLKMIDDLNQKGIKTILITEPFILSTSSKWQQAVENKVLAKDENGEPKRFDFYFGNTGLIDVFDENAEQWFANIYQELSEQGVAGVWGDLGEPEVHPDDAIHYFSEFNRNVRGDEIHNAYGHQWAKIVYQNQLKIQPDTRPFIMMRSGFAGSQRFGMIPWTGDVSRSWDGLKPQVELSLQMGLLGMGYTHSDLGGFAGGEKFDQELYIRWLQYGVFQPVYRPHAQDNIAPEPVFHDQQTRDIVREFVKLRYQLLPYNYTLAYQNSTTGMPLMRPLFFENDTDPSLLEIKDTYLWGDAFLVSPIVSPGESKHKMNVPTGVWFDFWNDTRYQVERSNRSVETIEVPVSLQTLPVLVRAGAFIPMTDAVATTRDYSSKHLTLHYYADESVTDSHGQMYEDDGESFASIDNGEFELLQFASQQLSNQIKISLSRSNHQFSQALEQRAMTVMVHNWKQQPTKVSFAGVELAAKTSLNALSTANSYFYDGASKQLTASFSWDHSDAKLSVE